MNYHLRTYKSTNLELKDNVAIITVILILAFLIALWIIIILDSIRNMCSKINKARDKKKNLKKMLAKVKRVGNVNEQSFETT